MKYKKLVKSEFVNNITTQLVGTGIAQLIPLLIMPLLTRFYTEKEFALFTSFMAYSAVLVVATGGRYQIAIVLPKNENEGARLFHLSIIITLIYTFILFILSLLVFMFFDIKINSNGIIFLIPLYVGFYGIWQSFYYLSVRFKKFKVNAFSKILQSVFSSIVSIILGLVISPIGMVMGKIAGLVSSVFYLHKKLELDKNSTKSITLKHVAKKYIHYPKYNIIPSLLDTFSLQVLIFLIEYNYSQSDLGYYGLTNLCLMSPLALITVSFKDVFYQKMAMTINSNNIAKARQLFYKSTLFLAFIGMLLSVVLIFRGEYLFTLLFGERWVLSGKFASILSISFLVKLIVSPLSSVLNATNNVKLLSIWQITYFVTTFTTLTIAVFYIKADIIFLLKIYVCHEIALYSLYYILQYNSLKKLTKCAE